MAIKWIKWLIVTCLGILVLSGAMPANAQEPTPENDANCVSCHEHEYYVYDRGKWFCLCEAPMHCVYCHGGRTDSLNKEIAHEGLVLYPTQHQAERCQTCHAEDYMSRVVTFETIAGVSSSPVPLITATAVSTSSMPTEAASPLSLHFEWMEPWQLIGLAVVTVGLVGVIILGYFCWKADCLAKKKFHINQ